MRPARFERTTNAMLAQPSPVRAQSPAIQEEVSRIVRVSRLLAEEPSTSERLQARLDTWGALAVVVLASTGVLYAGAWLIENWQLR